MVLHRHSDNPILTRRDIPELAPQLVDVTSVFNPGAVAHHGMVSLMLRVQSRGRETFLVMADSTDGVAFEVRRESVEFAGIDQIKDPIYHVYDPRITRIDTSNYIMFAVDMDRGCRLGVATSVDLESFQFVGLGGHEDVRNGVLFPERIGGQYVRLDRPNRVSVEGGPRAGDEIFLSVSDDLIDWKPVGSVMRGRPHSWDELVGPGPPPIRTEEGWLQVYHGIATHFGSTNIYQAGVMLLDADDPSTVIARGRNNILEPRDTYELVGQVPNVVFPSGLVVMQDQHSGPARHESVAYLYYGAADTSVGLATVTIGDLIAACYE
jgi:beta-1,4-mannooligosaccharide/beta-1,4-mannosyl-N-acetylglucosamine phosphorylase